MSTPSPPQGSSNPPPDPQHPPSFRERTVPQRTLWQSWAVLPANTRMRISLGVTALAALGVLVSNQLERVYPPDREGERRAEGASKEVPPP